MSLERTEAVVLRAVDFSETSRVVTFLTPGRGRVACLAKGVRRRNSPLAATLDTFNRVELVYYWKDGRNVQTLGDAALLDAYRALKSDLAKSAYAAFPLEIAYRAASENEPSETLYDTVVRGLAGMAAWQGDPCTHACWQALQLLGEAGFAPELGPPNGEPAGGFSFESGMVGPGQRADRRLSHEAVAGLRALRAQTAHCPEIGATREVFSVLWHFAAHQLETDFRSVRVIEQLFA